MPVLQPLLRDITGMARDTARDRMPQGMVWDLGDWIPAFADAPLRGRGGWVFQSNALPAQAGAMVYAPYQNGDKLLVMLDNNQVADVNISSVGSTLLTPTVWPTRCNPVFYNDTVYVFHKDGTQPPVGLLYNGSAYSTQTLPASTSNQGAYGAIYHDRLVTAGDARDRRLVAFSKPTNPVAVWEPTSIFRSAQPVTGLAVMRNMMLLFHKGSVERIRGTTPPDPTLSNPTGDMEMDTLFDKAGCWDARSIAYWQDNVVFADARGVHMTDGSIVRNLISQGGLLSMWRQAFNNAVSLCGSVFLDFYVCCLRTSDKPPLFLVCDLNKRTWYRFTNVDVTCMATSIGSFERLWGTDVPNLRTNHLSAMFFPDTTVLAQDADGKYVFTNLETGWVRGGKEGRKRIRHLYVSYDHRLAEGLHGNSVKVSFIHSPEATVWHDSRRMLRGTSEYRRLRVPVDLGAYGAAFKLTQLAPSYDLRLYDIGINQWAQEEGYLR